MPTGRGNGFARIAVGYPGLEELLTTTFEMLCVSVYLCEHI
jgi:hypothetical protein